MNRNRTRLIVVTLLVLLIAAQIQYFALAAPRTGLTLTTNVENILPGSTFIVTITFTSKDEDISVVEASIEYDADILQYRFGSNAVELSAGTGGISDNISPGMKKVSYDIRFTAIKPGTAKININHSQLIGQDTGSILGEPVGSTIVTVSSLTPPQDDGLPIDDPIEEDPPEDDDQTPTDDWFEITLDGEKVYIVRDLSDITLPQGFEIEDAIYENEEIQVARDSNRNLTLIYIRKRGFATLYVYDQHGSIYPYVNLDLKARYTILKTRDKPRDSEQTTLLLGGKPVQAWVSDRYGEDFYIVYAVNAIGNKGYYLYDAEEGSMQRLIADYYNANTIDEEN